MIETERGRERVGRKPQKLFFVLPQITEYNKYSLQYATHIKCA